MANINPTVLFTGFSHSIYTMTFESTGLVSVMKLHCPDNKQMQAVTSVPSETPVYFLFARIIVAYAVSGQFDL